MDSDLPLQESERAAPGILGTPDVNLATRAGDAELAVDVTAWEAFPLLEAPIARRKVYVDGAWRFIDERCSGDEVAFTADGGVWIASHRERIAWTKL